MLKNWTVRGIVALLLVVFGLLIFGQATLRIGTSGAMVMMALIMVVATAIVIVPPIIVGKQEPATGDDAA